MTMVFFTQGKPCELRRGLIKRGTTQSCRTVSLTLASPYSGMYKLGHRQSPVSINHKCSQRASIPDLCVTDMLTNPLAKGTRQWPPTNCSACMSSCHMLLLPPSAAHLVCDPKIRYLGLHGQHILKACWWQWLTYEEQETETAVEEGSWAKRGYVQALGQLDAEEVQHESSHQGTHVHDCVEE